MAEKVEGKIQDCWQCGEEITCRSVEYKGKTSLQWQNEDCTAHYKFISVGNYECRTSDSIDYDTPSTASDPANLPTGSVNNMQPPVKTKAEEQKLETSRLRGKFEELVKSGELQEGTTDYNVMKLYIKMLGVFDNMVITDEIKRGMLSNQANIRASSG